MGGGGGDRIGRWSVIGHLCVCRDHQIHPVEPNEAMGMLLFPLRNFYGGRTFNKGLGRVLTHVYPVLFLSQIVTTGRLLRHTEPLD